MQMRKKLRQMSSAKGFSYCLFVFLLTRYVLRRFVLESLLCGASLDFWVRSCTLGCLPGEIIFPRVHLNAPASAVQHQGTKKKKKVPLDRPSAKGGSLTRCPRIVEANPRKFNLDAAELGVRKAFITSTRQVVRVSNGGGLGGSLGGDEGV